MDNMATLNADEIEKLEKHDVHTLTDKLMKSAYPQLFLVLNQIGYLIQDLKPLLEKSLLLSIHQKMNGELTEIYQKEKQILFPLLLQLEKEKKASDSCKPFKNVKYHYTYLVSTTQQFKTQLNQALWQQKELKELQELKDLVQRFEEELIKVQHNKEQNLFKKFRNCSGGCKSL
jgi:iron-sulfur cluster repair protein YtfE (RIC family)